MSIHAEGVEEDAKGSDIVASGAVCGACGAGVGWQLGVTAGAVAAMQARACLELALVFLVSFATSAEGETKRPLLIEGRRGQEELSAAWEPRQFVQRACAQIPLWAARPHLTHREFLVQEAVAWNPKHTEHWTIVGQGLHARDFALLPMEKGATGQGKKRTASFTRPSLLC